MDVLADPSSTLVTPTPINVSRPSSPEAPSEKITGMKLIRLALRRPFHGILHDIRARAPFYASDFKDAWNYRVIPATAMIFFANVLPAIAFSLDLIETTGQYGVTEVLMASFVAAALFSIFAAQPLCIVGVTGPITVFNKTIYDILKSQNNAPPYLHFIAWVYLWAAIMHWVFAIFNGAYFLRYVTRFSCDTFGFFVAWVYVQYGIQMATRQFHESSLESAYVSLILSLLILIIAQSFGSLSRGSQLTRMARRFMGDYGLPIAVIAVSGCAYWGRFDLSTPSKLPVGSSFKPAGGRSWIVPFWDIQGDAKWIAISIPFGFALFILFAFDHQVSALMAQDSEFPLRKPPGFHWDFFLLGIMTLLSGILGVPAPNGLIPQAPLHTQALVIHRAKRIDDEEMQEKASEDKEIEGKTKVSTQEREVEDDIWDGREQPVAVVEQRVSNLVQGLFCLVLLTGPFLHLLSLVPRGVLVGLFWHMGVEALRENRITHRILYVLREKSSQSLRDPLRRVRNSRIVLFLALELVGFGATFAVVQNPWSAIGFTVIISLLIPVRSILIPKLPFTEAELSILDQPTASSFTMMSVNP